MRVRTPFLRLRKSDEGDGGDDGHPSRREPLVLGKSPKRPIPLGALGDVVRGPLGFVGERLREDVSVSHDSLGCDGPADHPQ